MGPGSPKGVAWPSEKGHLRIQTYWNWLSFSCRSFPSRVDACAECQALRKGDRGILAALASWAC